MAEDFYSAFMLRGSIGTTTDVTTVAGVGCYSVATGNATAPGSAAGVLFVLPPTSKPKRKFIKENDWNVYTLVNSAWQGLGNAAIHNVQTSKDDVTSNHVLLTGSALAIRTSKARSGSDITSADDLPINSVSFAYSDAVNGSGLAGSIFSFSGLNDSYSVQVSAMYGGGGKRIKFRTHDGDAKVWNAWYELYHTGHIPTATETGALPLAGGTLTGNLEISDTAPILTFTDTNQVPVKKYLLVCDGGDFRLDEDSTVGSNVFKWSSVTNTLTINGSVVPAVYGNFDARYISNLQLGAQVSVGRDSGGNNKAAAGYVVTGAYSTYQDSNWEMDNLFCKPLQKYINGAWVTISG